MSFDVALGVDVGGTKILLLAINRDGEILFEGRRTTPQSSTVPGQATAEQIHGLIVEALEALHRSLDEVVVGIGLPGIMSLEGELVFAPNLLNDSGARLADVLRALSPEMRVLCENDADCAAVAEHGWGVARGVANFVMVTLGTGIGGGVFVNGELLRGRSGFAGEIGHMVVDAKGPPCPCGSAGCWERYASGKGLARLSAAAAHEGRLPNLVAARGGENNVRGEDVSEAAKAGSSEAIAVIREVGWWLALGVSNLANILDCGLVVIGGGLSDLSAMLIPPAQAVLPTMVLGTSARPRVEMRASKFGERAGALGAGLLAFERLS
jgi:glucokinase